MKINVQRKGADVNKADDQGMMPLYVASEKGHCNVVEELLRGGADVNKANAYDATPLSVAIQSGHHDVVDALLRGGADVNKAIRDGSMLRYMASRKGAR